MTAHHGYAFRNPQPVSDLAQRGLEFNGGNVAARVTLAGPGQVCGPLAATQTGVFGGRCPRSAVQEGGWRPAVRPDPPPGSADHNAEILCITFERSVSRCNDPTGKTIGGRRRPSWPVTLP